MDYLLIIAFTILVMFSAVFVAFMAYLIFGDHALNVNIKQEFSAEDRALLEDLYNKDGDFKKQEMDMLETLDGAIREINSIMTGAEEETNG